MRTALLLLLLCGSVFTISYLSANWTTNHSPARPPAEPQAKQEIQTPKMEPGHVRIFNATQKHLGFMAYQRGTGVVCPKLPPSFGVTCIEVAAGKDVDLVLQPLAPELRR